MCREQRLETRMKAHLKAYSGGHWLAVESEPDCCQLVEADVYPHSTFPRHRTATPGLPVQAEAGDVVDRTRLSHSTPSDFKKSTKVLVNQSSRQPITYTWVGFFLTITQITVDNEKVSYSTVTTD